MADSLAVRHLSHGEMREYVAGQLGKGVFTVELTDSQLDAAIVDALTTFSKRKPLIGYKVIDVNPQIRIYSIDHDVGYGIFFVSFALPDPQPSAIFYANLLDVAPIKSTTMESYDIFLRWRKTFMRVASVQPRWEWNEVESKLLIYSPIERTKASYFWMYPRTLAQVPLQHMDWFKKYAVAKAKLTLGQARSKFQGVLPGPARDINLNGDRLVDEAKEEIELLEQELLSLQGEVPPLFV